MLDEHDIKTIFMQLCSKIKVLFNMQIRAEQEHYLFTYYLLLEIFKFVLSWRNLHASSQFNSIVLYIFTVYLLVYFHNVIVLLFFLSFLVCTLLLASTCL